MENKIEAAQALHKKGFNCAQAVAMAFCQELGVSEQLVMRAMEGFGAGMGDRQGTCGALSGAIFVAGLKHSDGNLQAPASKKQTYAICGGMCREFEAQCGSTVCALIKNPGDGKTAVPCSKCIELGVRLAQEA